MQTYGKRKIMLNSSLYSNNLPLEAMPRLIDIGVSKLVMQRDANRMNILHYTYGSHYPSIV